MKKYNQKLINKLNEVWKENPELNFIQLLINAITYRLETHTDFYYIQDDDLLFYLKEYQKLCKSLKKED